MQGQRWDILRVSSAHRTVSETAVMAGVILVHLFAKEFKTIYKPKRKGSNGVVAHAQTIA